MCQSTRRIASNAFNVGQLKGVSSFLSALQVLACTEEGSGWMARPWFVYANAWWQVENPCRLRTAGDEDIGHKGSLISITP